MDLGKITLPEAVEVSGKSFQIHTDFQFFISFSRMIKEKHLLSDYDFMYKNKIPYNKQRGLDALIAFAWPHKELPRQTYGQNDEIIIDYDIDADLIYSAFYAQYGIDLFKEDLHLHWHKFQSLLNGLKDTKLNDIMMFRSYIAKSTDGQEYKKAMLHLKEIWRIEPELTEEEKEVIAKFDAQLK